MAPNSRLAKRGLEVDAFDVAPGRLAPFLGEPARVTRAPMDQSVRTNVTLSDTL